LQELAKRVQDGELGDIILMRGYRMAAGELAACFSEKWPGDPTELLWQISVFHSFIWASGGLFNDFYIHHIDHLCMIKDAWPVKAQALGGRHYRNAKWRLLVDQNFDSYAVEYTFADGTKMYMDGRNERGCNQIYSSLRCMAAKAWPSRFTRRLRDAIQLPFHSGQNPFAKTWSGLPMSAPGQEDPYNNEWNDLVEAIRNDKPYNEVPRGIAASVTSSMGRMAAHTGQEITYDEMLNHQDVYAPGWKITRWIHRRRCGRDIRMVGKIPFHARPHREARV
jgi:hypothetical protein